MGKRSRSSSSSSDSDSSEEKKDPAGLHSQVSPLPLPHCHRRTRRSPRRRRRRKRRKRRKWRAWGARLLVTLELDELRHLKKPIPRTRRRKRKRRKTRRHLGEQQWQCQVAQYSSLCAHSSLCWIPGKAKSKMPRRRGRVTRHWGRGVRRQSSLSRISLEVEQFPVETSIRVTYELPCSLSGRVHGSAASSSQVQRKGVVKPRA